MEFIEPKDASIIGSVVRRFRIASHEDRRGILHPLDFSALPFVPLHAFLVQGSEAGVVRGGHAHRSCQQLFIRLSGAIDVEVLHGALESRLLLDRTGEALLVAPMVWSRQTYKTADSQLLVLASKPYDEADYINEQDFLLRANNPP